MPFGQPWKERQMVPRKVGEELRRRRLLLGLRQADIAGSMDRTRAYVSAIERGVKWDPDTDRLVIWAQTLGWPDDYILRALGRSITATTAPAVITTDLIEAIRRAVAEGVQEGVAEALQDRLDALGGTARVADEPRPGMPRERLA